MGRIENIVKLAAAAALLAACTASPPPSLPVAPVATAASATPSAAAATSADPKTPPVATVGTTTVRLGEKEAGKTIDAHVGDTVELTLPTNPTTGYDWQVDAIDRSLGQPTIARADGSAKAVGAATTMTFTWKIGAMMVDPPDHKVELAYRRPWEKGDPPEQSFKFTLHVVR